MIDRDRLVDVALRRSIGKQSIARDEKADGGLPFVRETRALGHLKRKYDPLSEPDEEIA